MNLEYTMKDRFTTVLPSNTVVVFGSNTEGWHGAGLAKTCKEIYGAIQYIGEGRQGQCYAIPTKERDESKPKPALKTMPLDKIYNHIRTFVKYAQEHPEITYLVSPIGCGYAGYKPKQIAPLFASATDIECIRLPKEFNVILNEYNKIPYNDPEAKYEF